MVRRNAKRNFIATFKKEDGSLTNSQEEVASEFVGFYHRLLGTNFTCEPIDPITFGEGPLLSLNPANALDMDISTQIAGIRRIYLMLL